MFYERLSKLLNIEFKRLTGIKRQTFDVMSDTLKDKYLEKRVCHEFCARLI